MGCPVCGDKIVDCGMRPVYDSAGHFVEGTYQRLFYCKECDANIEYTKLKQ